MLFLRCFALGLISATALAGEVPKQLHHKRTFDGPASVTKAYSDLHFTTLDSYNVLVKACATASVGEVHHAFDQYQVSVFTLSIRSREAWRTTPGLAVQFVDPFFQGLREFQVLLKFINDYPKLVLECRGAFNLITQHYNSIITDMRANGVEFSQPTLASAGFIDYELFQSLGITLSLTA